MTKKPPCHVTHTTMYRATRPKVEDRSDWQITIQTRRNAIDGIFSVEKTTDRGEICTRITVTEEKEEKKNVQQALQRYSESAEQAH